MTFSLRAMRTFPYFLLLHAMWQYLHDHRRTYFSGLSLVLIGSGLYMVEPYLIGRLVNVIQHDFNTQQGLYDALKIVLLIFLLEPVSTALYSPGRIMEQLASFQAKQNFVQGLYAKLQALPYAWHQDFHSGQLFDRIRKAENALNDFASNQYRYLGLVVNFFGPVIALFILFPWFSVACLLFVVCVIAMIFAFDRRLIALYTEGNRLAHVYAGVFSDYIANIRTIITLRLGRSTQSELLHRYVEQRPVLFKTTFVTRFKWGSIGLAAAAFKTGLIALGLVLFHKSSVVQIGSLIMLIEYLRRFSDVFYSIGEMYQEIVQQATDYKSVGIIDAAYQEHMHGHNKAERILPTDWQNVQIEDLSFAYDDMEHRRHTLQELSFGVTRGEKIALVGPSGAGKSTLMTLLRGLYIPHGGVLRIDGRTFPLDALADFTTLIPQDPEIFENTIRYNITFGVEHSVDEIMASCKIAAFDTVLDQLQLGLETDIREKGVNLSGGQRQRLALARGVFAIQESSLVLLDEPTSSVDTATEITIFENLFAAFADKTIIASVHRLHLLARFDRIIVMEKGRIVEEGDLQSLIARDGVFGTIWQTYQAEHVI
jgi:ATP-binding cassette subfamily B protein